MHDKSALAVFAHPDDETAACGGALAMLAARGYRTILVCATRGELGEISDPELATRESLPQVREAELRAAASALGISEVRFLDYRDSGMAGSAGNRDPRAFINQPAERVVERLAALMEDLRPEIVITFDPAGGYGHPDHIAIHRHTTAAFRRLLEKPVGWRPAGLYYSVFPRSMAERMMEEIRSSGQGTEAMTGMLELAVPDDQVDLWLDVGPVVERKLEAFRAHRTQFGPESPLGRAVASGAAADFFGRECFTQAWPPAAEGNPLQDALGGGREPAREPSAPTR